MLELPRSQVARLRQLALPCTPKSIRRFLSIRSPEQSQAHASVNTGPGKHNYGAVLNAYYFAVAKRLSKAGRSL